MRKARRDKVLSLVFCGALRIGEKAFARLAPVAQRLHWRTQRQSLPRSQRVAMSHRIAELERQLSSPNNSATPMDRGERPLSTPSRPTAQVPSVMCGRPRRSKGEFGMLRRGRVRSCVRPTLRGLMTAGPDAIRSLAPKQIYALEWRITLDGFFQAPGSTGSPSTPPSPSLTHQLWQPLMGFLRLQAAPPGTAAGMR